MYYHKDDREEFIRHLVEKFPKCFFDEPSHRRPLKYDIIDDLDKQKVLDREKLTHTLNWYQNHFIYQYGLIAGAERIDLDGNRAGTVTPKEEREARARVAARKRELKEQQTIRPAVLTPLRDMKRTDAPMSKTFKNYAANGAATASSLHPSLAEVQTAITIVSSILTEERYEPLRPALATTALREIIGKARS